MLEYPERKSERDTSVRRVLTYIRTYPCTKDVYEDTPLRHRHDFQSEPRKGVDLRGCETSLPTFKKWNVQACSRALMKMDL